MKSYKPKIAKAQALDLLTLRGRIFRSRRLIPCRIELIYLPYYFFQIRVKNKRGIEKEFYAGVDAILGGFSLVDKESLEPDEINEIEFEPCISLQEAEERLEKEARWFLVSRSLQMRESYMLLSKSKGELAFYPYWVGYYKNKSGAWEFLGLDAVSGVIQGGAGRRLFIHSFAKTRIKSIQEQIKE